MDGQFTMNFNWNQAKAFFITAEKGSLSSAARTLGISQSTLGRQVSSLEEDLGIFLFDRSDQGMQLTPNGLKLFEHVRAMRTAADQFSLTATGQSEQVEGKISITTSEVYAAYLLPSIIAKLRRKEPRIEVEIIASNTSTNLKKREADIALRSYRPTQPDLIARKLKEETAFLYATPEYLDRIGNPTTNAELSKADFVGFDESDALLKRLNSLGLDLTSKNFPILSENQLVQWELVKKGAAIGIMPSPIGEAEPLVQRVLPHLAPITIPMWLVAHQELSVSRRIRIVFDLIAQEISTPERI